MVLTSVTMITIEGDTGMSKVTCTEGWHAALQEDSIAVKIDDLVAQLLASA